MTDSISLITWTDCEVLQKHNGIAMCIRLHRGSPGDLVYSDISGIGNTPYMIHSFDESLLNKYFCGDDYKINHAHPAFFEKSLMGASELLFLGSAFSNMKKSPLQQYNEMKELNVFAGYGNDYCGSCGGHFSGLPA